MPRFAIVLLMFLQQVEDDATEDSRHLLVDFLCNIAVAAVALLLHGL